LPPRESMIKKNKYQQPRTLKLNIFIQLARTQIHVVYTGFSAIGEKMKEN